MRYDSLAALQQAYQDGVLGPEDRLIIDNDSSYLYIDGEPVYQGPGPEGLAREACDLLGIVWGNP